MKKILLGLLLISTAMTSYAQTADDDELPLNDSLYYKMEASNPLYGDDEYGASPKTAYSLLSICPKPVPINQTVSGLSWTSSVSLAMTVQLAYIKKWSPEKVTQQMFSSYFLYDMLSRAGLQKCRLNNDWIEETKRVLEDVGHVRTMDYSAITCKKPDDRFLRSVQRYEVRAFNRLFKVTTTDESIDTGGKRFRMERCIDRNHPIVLCIVADAGFRVLRDRTWTPKYTSAKPIVQTVVVVGYDSQQEVFEIVNPMNSNWGNGGVALLRYQDLKYAKYAFELVLSNTTRPPALVVTRPNPSVSGRPDNFAHVPPRNGGANLAAEKVTLQGELKLRTPATSQPFVDVPLKRHSAGYYQPTRSYAVSSQFQLVGGQAETGSYMYVFSVDPNGKAQMHYPYKLVSYGMGTVDLISPVVPGKLSKVIVPQPRISYDTEGRETRIDRAMIKEYAGTDWLVVLYSDRRLDGELNELIRELTNHNRDFMERFRHVFGQRLIAAPQIQQKGNLLQFAANTQTKGYIIPIVVKLDAN